MGAETGISCNIVILGGAGVGKSAITVRLVKGTFLETYDPTVEDSFKFDLAIGNKSHALEIIDTAGQEEYSSLMLDQYLRFGDCFLIVFSIVDEESFELCQSFYDRVCKSKESSDIPIILVGNKSDLDSDRKITGGAARSLAQDFSCEYMETSAKSGEVEHVFKRAVKLIEESKQKKQEREDAEEAERKRKKSKNCLMM